MKKRWEYKIVQGGKGMTGAKMRDASIDILNRQGMEGWECYAVNSNTAPTVFYLKRER